MLCIIVNEQNRVVYWNSECEAVTGYKTEEILKDSSKIREYESGKPYVRRLVEILREKGEKFNGAIIRLKKKGGGVRDISWHTLPDEYCYKALDNSDNICFLGIDLTDLQEKAKSQREFQEKYTAVFENASHGIFFADASKRRILDFNSNFCRMLGYEAEEMKGMELKDLIFKKDTYYFFNELLKECEQMPDSEAKVTESFPMKRKDGSQKLVILILKAIELGRGLQIMGAISGSGYKRRFDEMIKRLYEYYSKLFSSISSIFISLYSDTRVSMFNAQAECIFEINSEEILGRPLEEIEIGWEWDKIMEGIEESRKEGKQLKLDDVCLSQKDGSRRLLGLTINPVCNLGSIIGFVLLGADITERKQSQTQMTQMQRMESIGQLAAGIAHEINTPTQYVGDNVRFLSEGFNSLSELIDEYEKLVERCRKEEIAVELLDRIEALSEEIEKDYLLSEMPDAIEQSQEGISRVTRIVAAMKNFSHPGNSEKTLMDINKAIENAITVTRNEWKYTADMETEFDPGIPMIFCIPGDFNQIMLNLIVNAAHAVSGKVKEESDEKGKIRITTGRDGDYVEIRVIDSGSGINNDIRERIFDPFFTTKEVGVGTGQGLSIVHNSVVNRHGGTIDFETESGEGTTFIVRLPV